MSDCNNIFKRIIPIQDAKNQASEKRNELYNTIPAEANIKTDAKSVLIKKINRIGSGLETEIGRGDNSFIIIGKSREHIPASGPYAISGVVNCDSVDVSVGLGYIPESVDKDAYNAAITGGGLNPSFIYDKARVYLTENSDVDTAFGISNIPTMTYSTTNQDKPVSAVVVKADVVRTIGRSSIKLITGKLVDCDKSNSDLGDCGVELISTSGKAALQPMVLGNNLVETLNDIIEHHNVLAKILSNFMLMQLAWDQSIATHMHFNVFPNTPDIGLVNNLVPKLTKNLDNISKVEIDNSINSAVTKAKMKSISKSSLLSSYHKLN